MGQSRYAGDLWIEQQPRTTMENAASPLAGSKGSLLGDEGGSTKKKSAKKKHTTKRERKAMTTGRMHKKAKLSSETVRDSLAVHPTNSPPVSDERGTIAQTECENG